MGSLKFEDADFAGVISYQPSTSSPVSDNSVPVTALCTSETAPLAASEDFQFNGLHNPDFTHNPQT